MADLLNNLDVTEVLGLSNNMNKTFITDYKEYYQFLEQLGEGSFCKVYRALYKPLQEIIAVKVSVLILSYFF
jgi:serine/threonine protein kinase